MSIKLLSVSLTSEACQVDDTFANGDAAGVVAAQLVAESVCKLVASKIDGGVLCTEQCQIPTPRSQKVVQKRKHDA